MPKDYYVYILIDPRDKRPFYVGKGKGNRYQSHEKEYWKQYEYYKQISSVPEKLFSLKERVFHELFLEEMKYEYEIIEVQSEEDAHLLEHSFIAWFGRKMCGNGILTNLLSGGKRGELLFDEQLLLNIYTRRDLSEIITQHEKTSTDWVAKTLYFFDKSKSGYPFKELSVDWLYQYHTAFQLFALEVVKKLKTFDSVLTPFYWVRKVQRQKVKDDKLYIMNESEELIRGTLNAARWMEDFEYYKLENERIVAEGI